MPNIMDVVTAMGTKQAALAITAPLAMQVKKVFLVPPKRSQALNDFPCVINTWKLDNIEWGLDVAGGPRHEFYSITVQVFVADADLDQGALIASAFLAKYITSIEDDYTLGGLVQQLDIRGGDPTLGLLEWAGQAYVGLNLYIDAEIVNYG